MSNNSTVQTLREVELRDYVRECLITFTSKLDKIMISYLDTEDPKHLIKLEKYLHGILISDNRNLPIDMIFEHRLEYPEIDDKNIVLSPLDIFNSIAGYKKLNNVSYLYPDSEILEELKQYFDVYDLYESLLFALNYEFEYDDTRFIGNEDDVNSEAIYISDVHLFQLSDFLLSIFNSPS